MEIELGRGYGSFLFGMSERQIIDVFGNPDKKYPSEFKEIYYEYHNYQVALKFEDDLGVDIGYKRLGLIEVKERNSTIFGRRIWNDAKLDIISFLEKKINSNGIITDYGGFESICFDEYWLELQLELGRLTSINIGVLLDSNEKPIWSDGNQL